MLAIALAATVVVGCSVVVGQAVAVLGGRAQWAWWSPGVGCGLLIALAGLLIRAPGRATTVAIVIAVLTAAGLLSRAVRAALATALPELVPVAALTLLTCLLPFAVTGRSGILGAGVNNDMSAHLTTAWWLQHRMGSPGIGAIGGALPDVGYPLGPHGLAAALSLALHTSLVHAFDAVIIVAAPLTALVALGALGSVTKTAARFAGAVLVGLCYLSASYLGQAAFKETLEGLMLVTAVLVTCWLVRSGDVGWRSGLPLGAVLGGALHLYSYPGLAWPLGAIAAVALAEGGVRRVLRAAPGAAVAAALLIAPAAGRIADFYNSPFSGENHNGNLVHALNPVEALGVWLGAEFRFHPDPAWPTVVFGSVAAVAFVVAVVRLLGVRRRALPAGLAVAVGLFLYTVGTKSIYVSAKALAVLAPLAALTMATGLLAPGPGRARLIRLALASVVAVAAAASSFISLRDAHVGPMAHEQELASLRTRLGRDATLFMGKDDFAQWELHGTNVAVGRTFYAPAIAPLRPSNPVGASDPLDFDNFLPATLDRFHYVISGNSPYQSAAPRNFRAVARTQSYVLWERHGPTALRYPLDPHGAPGAVLDCASPLGRVRLGGAGADGTAGVLPQPVVAGQSSWRGQPKRAGQSGTLTVRLPKGAWDLSLQYASSTGLDVRAGSMRRRLPATLDRIGPYYRVGAVRMSHAGELTVVATARAMNGFARLLGAPGATRALGSPGNLPLAGVALTPRGARERVLPVRSACGRYVDWVAPRPRPS